MTQREWMDKNAFGEDNLTWCVFGDDTYAIKDWLKEHGCKYHPILKWHSPVPIDVPVGYGMFSVNFDDVCQWSVSAGTAYFTTEGENLIEKKSIEAAGPSLSEYVGSVGERLRNLTAHFKSARSFAGRYGQTNIYTFTIGEDVLVWFTTSTLDIEPGVTVDLTGTVKKHEMYKGIKTTQLSRCKIIEIEG